MAIYLFISKSQEKKPTHTIPMLLFRTGESNRIANQHPAIYSPHLNWPAFNKWIQPEYWNKVRTKFKDVSSHITPTALKWKERPLSSLKEFGFDPLAYPKRIDIDPAEFFFKD